LERRADQLRPYVEELAQIESALQALDALPPGESAGARQRSRSARPAGTARRRTSPRGGASSGRGDRAPRGKRRDELLELVTAQPGIRVRDAAGRMGISPSQTHGLVARLGGEGLLERVEGSLWLVGQSPAGQASGSDSET
jgi:hypothetical protein